MDQFNQAIKDFGVKGLLTGATMAVGSMTLFGDSGNINVLGATLPAYVPIGSVGVLSSIIGDAVTEYVLPHIPQDEKLKNLESAALNFAASGGAFPLILKVTTGINNDAMPKAFVFGGSSKLLSDAVYNQYINREGGGFIL